MRNMNINERIFFLAPLTLLNHIICVNQPSKPKYIETPEYDDISISVSDQLLHSQLGAGRYNNRVVRHPLPVSSSSASEVELARVFLSLLSFLSGEDKIIILFLNLIFQNLSVNASIFTLTAIAVDRYKAIMFPLKSHASKSRTKVIILIIWIVSAILAVPMAIAFRAQVRMNSDSYKCVDL